MTETDVYTDPDGRILRVLVDGEPMELNSDISRTMSFKRVDGEFRDADPGEFPTFVMDMDGPTPSCKYNPNHLPVEDAKPAPYTVSELDAGEWYELTPPDSRPDLPTIRVEYPKSDGDTPFADPGEFPRYEWELYSEQFKAYALYRRTKTKTKAVWLTTTGDQHPVAISEDPTYFEGTRHVARERFIAAVKAMFLHGPSPYSGEEIREFTDGENLEWYERDFLQSLRYRRNSNTGRKPGEPEKPGLTDELWDLVSFARSEITLSDWMGGDTDREKKAKADVKQNDLSRFAGGESQ